MAKVVKITASSTDKPLSKEQKKFNNYIAKIRETKDLIVQHKDDNQWLLQLGMSSIMPAKDALNQVKKDFAYALDSSPYAKNLSAGLKKKRKELILFLVTDLIFQDDQMDMIPLYDKYNPVSFEEEKKAAMSSSIDSVKQMMEGVFGLNIDLTEEDLENPEDVMRKIHQKLEEDELEEEKIKEEKRKSKPKTAKQLEKEQKQKEAEKKLTQTSKRIYLELVKHFHPDGEQDEAERERKTVLMQEINAAYDNDDFLTLLDLQINLLENKTELLSKTPDESLLYYNKILREQLNELKDEAISLNPNRNGHPFGNYFRPERKTTEAAIKREVKNIKKATDHQKQGLELLGTERDYRLIIKHTEIPREEDGFFSTLMGLFK